MIRRPPISTRTDTLFPYTTLFRSLVFTKAHMRIDKSPRGPVTSFLRRRAALSALADIGWRVVLLIALMGIVLLVHWFERDSLYDGVDGDISRSEDSRVGKECVSPCRSRGSPSH